MEVADGVSERVTVGVDATDRSSRDSEGVTVIEAVKIVQETVGYLLLEVVVLLAIDVLVEFCLRGSFKLLA